MTRVVALTGGTGFLGFSLVPALLRRGYNVRLLRRPGSEHPLMRSLPAGAEGCDVDFADESAISKACTGAFALIHAAGLVSYNRADQPLMHATNVELTARMLAGARRADVRRFVHVSSIVTLGIGSELRDETVTYNAAGLGLAYWDTKTEAERLALAANAPDFEVVSVNPGSLLGPGEKNGQLRPFLKKLARVERPLLPDGGSDFLDVRDGAEGTVLGLERGRPGERYVLGAENLTYVQLHQRLREALGRPSRARVLPRGLVTALERGLSAFEGVTGVDLPINAARLKRVNGVYMFHDLAKARRELGYNPGPILSALRAMLEEEG